MDDEQKSRNRWNLTKAILLYIAMYGVGLLWLSITGNATAVSSLSTFILGIIGLASTVIGVNFATPPGGFKK